MQKTVRMRGKAGTLAGILHVPEGYPPFPGVQLCHGLASRKENYADLAILLCEAGFVVLTLDCRGHGQSEGALDDCPWQDALTGLEYLQRRREVDGHRLALAGASMGANHSLHAAVRVPEVRTVVAFNTAPNEVLRDALFSQPYWERIGLSTDRARICMPEYLQYLQRSEIYELPHRLSPRPLFFLHGRNDEMVPFAVSEALYAAAAPGSRLWVVDGCDHAGLRHDARVLPEVIQWLCEKLA